MDKSGKKSQSLEEIARAAAAINILSSEELFEAIAEGMNKMREQLQMLIDIIVGMQGEWPMPEEGWKQFVDDIQRTNERFGYNLRINPNIEPIAYSSALEKYAASINKTRDELDEDERKQAMMDAVLARIDPSQET